MRQPWRQEVDVGGRHVGVGELRDGLCVGVGAEQAVGARTGRKHPRAATDDAGGDAGVGVGIRNPHIRRRSLEQAQPAAQLHFAFVFGGLEGVIEAHARLEEVCAVNSLRIVATEAAAVSRDGVGAGHRTRHRGGCGSGIEQWLVAGAELVVSHATRNGELLVELPGVLQEKAGVGQRPFGNAGVQRAARHWHLHLVIRRPAAREILKHSGFNLRCGGSGAIEGGDVAVEVVGECRGVGGGVGCHRISAPKCVIAVGVLEKRVVDLVAFQVGTEFQFVVGQCQRSAQVAVNCLGV